MNWLTKKATSFLFIKKKTVLFVLFFIFLGIFFPIKTAFAAWYDFLIGAVTFIPMVTIALILSVIVMLSALLAAFGGLVLNWVLSPGFMEWSYTNPATNPIIKIGLDITQPFVNMILVLVLVFIALATILRLAGYETKKLLPAFIIIALLVNFAPVICGLIIDASNIIMNFFTKEITGGQQLISMLKSVVDIVVGKISWETFKATEQIELVLTLVVLTVVNLALFLVLELFALVFMLRYMVIWLLVILSPLAFVCYILPATRKIWDLWWKQFIQWSIIGITMGFFLYLADQFTTQIPGIDPEFTQGLGGAVLPALFPLIFLVLGFVFGLTTGAMGTEQVMAGFKRGTEAARKTAVAKGWEKSTQAVRAEAGRIKGAYKQFKGFGYSGPRAAGETARLYWQRKVQPAAETIKKTVTTKEGRKAGAKAGAKALLAVGGGVWQVVGESAKSGWKAGWKIKSKKKGETCPHCKTALPLDSDYCPNCGLKF